MREAQGNLWDYPATVTVVTTNGAVRHDGAAVMGRGCAREATQRHPGIEWRLGHYLRAHGNRCFRLASLPGGCWLVSMPVKHHWKEEADLGLIITSARQLVEMADKFHWGSVVLPRPGCGNGRLDWQRQVRPALEPILDDRFTVITFPEV